MASGMPSSLRQISTTASASPGWDNEKSDTTLWARSTKRFTAADSVPELTSSDGTRHNCSSLTPTPSRLVARTVTVAEAARIASTKSATLSTTCSQLSNTNNRTLPSTAEATDSVTVLPSCWVQLGDLGLAPDQAGGRTPQIPRTRIQPPQGWELRAQAVYLDLEQPDRGGQ